VPLVAACLGEVIAIEACMKYKDKPKKILQKMFVAVILLGGSLICLIMGMWKPDWLLICLGVIGSILGGTFGLEAFKSCAVRK